MNFIFIMTIQLENNHIVPGILVLLSKILGQDVFLKELPKNNIFN